MGSLIISTLNAAGPALLRGGVQLAASAASTLLARGGGGRGPRLSELHVQGSSEGAPIPLLFGRARLAGQVIWAAPFRQQDGRGGKTPTQGRYTVSFAVGLCEGPVARLERAWANGRPLDLAGFAWRLHRGEETQQPDPLIEAQEGADAPAYRGLAYVVFEDFPLDEFGASLPQLSFEISRGAIANPLLERRAQGVCLIPGAGEFVYADQAVRRVRVAGATAMENAHLEAGRADLLVSLDQLQQDLPNVRSVLLVLGWFGSDLRAGACEIRPKVDNAAKQTLPLQWRVAGLERGEAAVVSLAAGAPAYGGTPGDETVLAAIAALKRRGFKVGLYPFLFMDIPPGNGLPDPDGGAEQAAYPWRGRIRPAAADGAAAIGAEIAQFFGTAQEGDFDAAGAYQGPPEWRYRRLVLHYAALARAAGGVDSFVLGSELRGLTTAFDAAGAYPAVAQLRSLAGACRALLGPAATLTYAADWSEYGAHQPAPGALRFPLDPLWADPALDAVGIDWYPPLSDWREGGGHLDAAASPDGRDLAYLQSRIEGGEAFDWFYASEADRRAQHRTPITDGAHGKPWVHRAKDLRGWWSNPHFERVNGAELAAPTAWTPQAKPIWLIELGCPAIDKGANQPNLFLDPKSAESAPPFASTGAPDDLIQRRTLEAYLDYWAPEHGRNPISGVYGGPMVAPDGVHLWCWDARPFPAFPARADLWADGPAWRRGHWLNGRAGSSELAGVIAELCARAGLSGVDAAGVRGVLSGCVVDGPASAREALEPLLTAFDVRVVESGGRIVFRHAAAGETVLDEGALIDAPELERADSAAPAARLDVTFLDPAGEYRLGVVSALSGAPQAVEVERVDLPIVLEQSLARGIAERLLARRLEGRERARLRLAPQLLALEPGDRATLLGAAYEIEAIEEGMERALRLRRASAGTARVLASEPPAPSRPEVFSPPHCFVLDLPPLPGAEEGDARPLAAAFANPWGGPLEVYAGAEEALLRPRGELVQPARIARLEWALYPGPVGRWDDGADIEAAFLGDPLDSVSDAALLEGANRCAVIAPDGAVEIVQIARAELAGPGRYRLRRFLRGLGGGEARFAPAGSWLVVLDGRLARVGLEPEERGADLLWRFQWRRSSDPGARTGLSRRLDAAWARPFAPAQVRVARLAGGDVLCSWVRQARLGGDGWGQIEPPLGEEREAYAVTVLLGAQVLRRWEVTQPPVVYTAAEQQADGAQGALRFRIAQISASAGEGAGAESGFSI